MSALTSTFFAPLTGLKSKKAVNAQRTAVVPSAKAVDVSLAPPTTRVPPQVPEGEASSVEHVWSDSRLCDFQVMQPWPLSCRR